MCVDDLSEPIDDQEVPLDAPPASNRHVFTDEERERGLAAAHEANLGPRTPTVIRSLLKNKADLDIIANSLTARVKPVFLSVMKGKRKENSADATNQDALAGVLLACGLVNARDAHLLLNRLDGMPVQAVQVQEVQALKTILPTEMLEIQNKRRTERRAKKNGGAVAVDAGFEKVKP